MSQTLTTIIHRKTLNCVGLLTLTALLGQVGAASTTAPVPAWTKDLKALGSLAIADNGELSFIGSDAKLHRLDSRGQEKWSYPLGDIGRAQPVLTAQGITLVAAYDDTLQALDPSGKKLWALKLDGDLFASPALRPDGSIIAASSVGSVYAVSANGQVLWQYKAGAPIYSSPIVDSAGHIYFGTQGNTFVSLDGSGALLWRFHTGATVFSSPALDAAGNLYFGSGDSTIYSLTPSGERRWAYKTGGFVNASPIVTSSGLVVVGSYDGKLYALDTAGQLRWTYSATGSIAAPAAELADGTLLVGDLNGTLHALNLNGQPRWTLKAGEKIDTSVNVSPQGVAYVETGGGKVSALGNQAPLADGPWSFYRQQAAGYGRPPSGQEQARLRALKQAALQKALASLPKTEPSLATVALPSRPAASVAAPIVPVPQLGELLRQEGGQLFLPADDVLLALGVNQAVTLPGGAVFSLGATQNTLPIYRFDGRSQGWVALKDLSTLNGAQVHYLQGRYQLQLGNNSKPALDFALATGRLLSQLSNKEFPDIINY